MRFKQFAAHAKERGLQARDCGAGHWQVIGGPLLVNFYPNAKRGPVYYVAGTTRGVWGSAEEALAAAGRPPVIGSLPKDSRSHRQVYRRWKERLLAKARLPFDPVKCWWCATNLLTLTDITVDHKIPLHRGGLDNPNNWVPACKKCNGRRGHDMPELTGGSDEQ